MTSNEDSIRMTPSPAHPVSPSVRNHAIRWMVRLRSGEDVTSTDRDQFNVWLAEHPTHRQEFERLSHMWNTLDQAKPLLQRDLDEAVLAGAHDRPNRAPEYRVPVWQQSSHLPITAGLLMALVALTFWWWLMQPTEAIVYQTAKGEQRQVVLTDGSLVTLNTDTTILVQMSDTQRMVSLNRGEAWFTVTHDERRPFRVQAGNGAIQDLGTQFIVHKSPQKVQVSVLEGLVAVDLIPSAKSCVAAQPMIVERGERVWYDADGHLSAIGSFDLATVGAWKEGKLIFHGLPLEQVLTEVARYRSEEIHLLDQSVGQVPVSGVFNIHNLESFVRALQDALPIRATWVTPQLVIVEPAPARATKSALSTRN